MQKTNILSLTIQYLEKYSSAPGADIEWTGKKSWVGVKRWEMVELKDCQQ